MVLVVGAAPDDVVASSILAMDAGVAVALLEWGSSCHRFGLLLMRSADATRLKSGGSNDQEEKEEDEAAVLVDCQA